MSTSVWVSCVTVRLNQLDLVANVLQCNCDQGFLRGIIEIKLLTNYGFQMQHLVFFKIHLLNWNFDEKLSYSCYKISYCKEEN